jgi:hypothetical protein
LSDEERRERRNAYQRKWRREHPWSWEAIWRRAYGKRKEGEKEGVEVELDLGHL